MLAPPKVVIEGPNQTDVGSSVSIRCDVLEGYPLPTVSITTPQGEMTEQSLIMIPRTTMEDAGNYSCVANNLLATVTSNLSLIVYGSYAIHVAIIITLSYIQIYSSHSIVDSSTMNSLHKCIYGQS